jgi:hypothetical protein
VTTPVPATQPAPRAPRAPRAALQPVPAPAPTAAQKSQLLMERQQKDRQAEELKARTDHLKELLSKWGKVNSANITQERATELLNEMKKIEAAMGINLDKIDFDAERMGESGEVLKNTTDIGKMYALKQLLKTGQPGKKIDQSLIKAVTTNLNSAIKASRDAELANMLLNWDEKATGEDLAYQMKRALDCIGNDVNRRFNMPVYTENSLGRKVLTSQNIDTTLLAQFAQLKNTEPMLQELLTKEADLSASTGTAVQSLLMMACRGDNVDGLDLLIDRMIAANARQEFEKIIMSMSSIGKTILDGVNDRLKYWQDKYEKCDSDLQGANGRVAMLQERYDTSYLRNTSYLENAGRLLLEARSRVDKLDEEYQKCKEMCDKYAAIYQKLQMNEVPLRDKQLDAQIRLREVLRELDYGTGMIRKMSQTINKMSENAATALCNAIRATESYESISMETINTMYKDIMAKKI